MCGLVAIVSYASAALPVDHRELLAMREAMAARGPDGSGLWISDDGRVGLAHRRLSLRDLSEAGAQPMASGNGALRIVYNGEIYNFCELRRALFMPWEIERILDPEVARAGWQRLLTGLRLEETVSEIHSPSLKVTALESVWYMRNQLLRDSDLAGMAHSVEIRTPIADLEVMRVAAPISAHGGLKQRKGDLPDLPSTPLPRGVVERRKTGLLAPVQEWVEHCAGGTTERGLRAWARHLAQRFGFELSGNSRASSLPPVL